MPRVPSDEIDRLKAEVSLVRLAEAAGVKLEKRGADFVGRCPFHEDKTPSFVVTPKKNLWNCLGACGIGGDVIAFVMKAEGVSFRHAVELLQNDYEPVTADRAVAKSTVQKLEPLRASKEDAKLLAQVIDYYHETLKTDTGALDYLKKRGLDNADMIERFKLGLANRTLGYRLPAKNRAAGAELRGRLQSLGILRESGHEHFAGSLVIPVIDAQGQVKEAYGRKLLDNLRAGTPKHLYLPGPHAGVFNLEAFAVSDEMILCEALIDALTFWSAGFCNVTSAYGTNGFTPELLDTFKTHGIKRALIAFDRDAAGDAAAGSVSEQLMRAGVECYRIQFPKGMDANAYATQVTPAAKSLGALIRSAAWMGNGEKPAMPESSTPEPAATPEIAAKGKTSEHAPSIPLAANADPSASDTPEVESPPPDIPEPAASPVPPAPPEIPANVAEHAYEGGGNNGAPFVMGLIDVEVLRRSDETHGYDKKKSGVKTNLSALEAELSGSSRPQVGGMSGPSRGGETRESATLSNGCEDAPENGSKNAYKGEKNPSPSYANGAVPVGEGRQNMNGARSRAGREGAQTEKLTLAETA